MVEASEFHFENHRSTGTSGGRLRLCSRPVTHSEPVTDLDLVRRTVDAGDSSAFDELVRRHLGVVHGFLSRFTGDPEMASDFAQESFLRAFRGLKGYAGDAPFAAWLLRIARNVAISGARSAAARPTLVSIDDLSSSIHSDPHAVADHGASPMQRLLDAESRQAILAAMRSLPSEFREILLLRDFDDRPYDEIAEIVGIPLGTVRSRLHRGRGLLRDALCKLLPERSS